MAEISKARWGQYKNNVLDILSKHTDGLHWIELFTKLEEVMPANEFENSSYESNGQRRRPYIVRFATIAIVKAGWLIKEKGIWTITEAGKEALVKYARQTRKYRNASVTDHTFDYWHGVMIQCESLLKTEEKK
jgi:restriction system protein